ncbi:MAG: hypothetical protein M1826_006308 [Phylliscum demangeonii]|nr:MAG: hypothetical protein M1826_006308 [Phylliscum demangeonii]
MQFPTTILLTATLLLGATQAAPAPGPAHLKARDAPNCNACVHNTDVCLNTAYYTTRAGSVQSMIDAYNACIDAAKASAVCRACPTGWADSSSDWYYMGTRWLDWDLVPPGQYLFE